MKKDILELRVAVVHEWLDEYAGSELVLSDILRIFPQADVFCLVDYMQEPDREFLRGRRVRPSFIQRLPFARKHYRKYLPLMPLAVEALDVSAYDLVISSSHAVAKGVLTGPDQVHICYCYTPLRYAWDLQHQYLKLSRLTSGIRRWVALLILHYLRIWDVRTADGVDVFLTSSKYIARRIRRVYRRSAEVIYPAIRTDIFKRSDSKEDFYLAASRIVPYKRTDVILDAFAKMPSRRLVFVNSGGVGNPPQVSAPNITMLGRLTEPELIDLMQRAKAFVFAAEEDFGITMVEAQSCGTPVICYGKGGAVETVVDGETGVLFDEQTPASLINAVERFETLSHRLTPARARVNAERFSADEFEANLLAAVHRALDRSQELQEYEPTDAAISVLSTS